MKKAIFVFDGMFEIFNDKKEEGEETEISYPEPSSPDAPAYSSGQSRVFVVSVGGSVLIGPKPDAENISRITCCLNELIRQGHKLVLVTGGGKVCRDYVRAAKDIGSNNFELDELGIKVSRVNASLLIQAIENAHPEVLTGVKQAAEVLEQGKTPVFGGLMPGFTTDAVAALLAEYLGGTFVNLSNVDGIFTADPAIHSSAVMYHEIGYDKLFEILLSNTMKPSQNLIVDLPAAMILKRSSLTAFFLNGQDAENLKAAIQGMPFKGTIVRPGAEELFDEEQAKPKRKRAVRKKPAKRKPASKKKSPKFYEDDDEDLDPEKIKF